MIDFVAVVRDPSGLATPAAASLPIAPSTTPVITKFINWWDGQFVRMRWYGTDYLIFANSGWNEASFRTLITVGVTEPTPQFYPPTHSIIIEVWSAPDGKAKYLRRSPPDFVKDMRDTDGLWLVNYNLLLGTFYRHAGIPMPASDLEPT